MQHCARARGRGWLYHGYAHAGYTRVVGLFTDYIHAPLRFYALVALPLRSAFAVMDWLLLCTYAFTHTTIHASLYPRCTATYTTPHHLDGYTRFGFYYTAFFPFYTGSVYLPRYAQFFCRSDSAPGLLVYARSLPHGSPHAVVLHLRGLRCTLPARVHCCSLTPAVTCGSGCSRLLPVLRGYIFVLHGYTVATHCAFTTHFYTGSTLHCLDYGYAVDLHTAFTRSTTLRSSVVLPVLPTPALPGWFTVHGWLVCGYTVYVCCYAHTRCTVYRRHCYCRSGSSWFVTCGLLRVLRFAPRRTTLPYVLPFSYRGCGLPHLRFTRWLRSGCLVGLLPRRFTPLVTHRLRLVTHRLGLLQFYTLRCIHCVALLRVSLPAVAYATFRAVTTLLHRLRFYAFGFAARLVAVLTQFLHMPTARFARARVLCRVHNAYCGSGFLPGLRACRYLYVFTHTLYATSVYTTGSPAVTLRCTLRRLRFAFYARLPPLR